MKLRSKCVGGIMAQLKVGEGMDIIKAHSAHMENFQIINGSTVNHNWFHKFLKNADLYLMAQNPGCFQFWIYAYNIYWTVWNIIKSPILKFPQFSKTYTVLISNVSLNVQSLLIVGTHRIKI